MNVRSKCTIITAISPEVITKEFRLKKEGGLDKITTAHVSKGSMEEIEFIGLNGFVEILLNLKPNQCLTYGCPNKSPAKLVTEKEWLESGRNTDTLPRSQKYFNWPDGSGVLMLDYDAPKNGTKPKTKDELVALIRSASPGLKDVAMVWWPSTSSCIWYHEQEFSGIKGQRIYILLKNAKDIPRTANAILTMLWAEGVGSFEVSKSGSLLERGLFDSSVWQTNRIDFAAGALCHDGLEQRRGSPEIIDGSKEIVDSLADIPEPTIEQKNKAFNNKNAIKSFLKNDANEQKIRWKNERISAIKLKNPNLSDNEIESITERAIEQSILNGEWVITIINPQNQKQKISISECLENPDSYDGALTLDPIEPDYDNERPVGKLILKSGRQRLHSFAHGGRNFFLSKQQIKIEILKGNERVTTDRTISALMETNEVYSFGADLATVGNSGELMLLDEHSLRYTLGGIVQYWRSQQLPRGGNVEILENPPVGVCKNILALGSNVKLKKLDAVITAPILRKNGSLLNLPGYDICSRLYFDMNDDSLPIVHTNPTKAQARAALSVLFEPFLQFPFSTDLDRSVFFAALLTAAVRSVLDTAPAFAFDAPTQGSGKTLLAKSIGVIASGKLPDVWPDTERKNDEEVRKRIFTAFRAGLRVIIWDNIVGAFDSPAMAACITSENYRDRQLGKSESIAIPNRSLLLMTGNNLTFVGDMARRVLTCRIDPKTDKPFAREFEMDPLTHCLNNRQEMVASALTLIRFYLSSGQCKPGAGRLASFEQWDDWIRQTVIYVGQELNLDCYVDVMEKIQTSQATDPDQEVLSVLLEAWFDVFAEKRVTVNEVLSLCRESTNPKHQVLINALKDFSAGRDVLSTRSIGKTLKNKKDRIVCGKYFELAGNANNTSLWKVKHV